MKDVNSIDEIFGTKEFVRDLKAIKHTESKYQHTNILKLQIYRDSSCKSFGSF